MAGTPFISLLKPNKLEGFERGKPHHQQPPRVPKVFIDAMEVRESVFVTELKGSLENEIDDNDPRSCHWVAYASVNKTEEAEIRDDQGNVAQPRKSSTRSTPVGTIRLVPFPHNLHTKTGDKMWNGHSRTGSNGRETSASSPPEAPAGFNRPTKFHDGKEPYVLLGRLAVVKEFRGNGLSALLVQTVLAWLKSNPSIFDPSITGLGLEHMGASNEAEIPKWGGLVCVHAPEPLVAAWAKWGFEVDDEMGRWWEEDIPHVGMFRRLRVDTQQVRIMGHSASLIR